ncbi:tetratricopeptide repeat protein [Actinospica durhamensis]|uniref:Tetratricopeptide repeat protein n=1 Tax=Actinospica durhamensis TaxID=1508375 RepID=A0A941EV96_9ACTN|nr:tetratricopeptide repeat protein [Actinospica durhamensis]MBR7838940.1 tetratricopeptide repeat protein [Actinospica durhamensis]
MPEGARHLWIEGDDGPGRAARAAEAKPTISVDCHRRLRGPYTGLGTVLRHLVPGLTPTERAAAQRHVIEVLVMAPELSGVLEPAPGTLTSGAMFGERTRWYSALRTRRLAHGIIDLLRELRELQDGSADAPLVLAFDRVDEADATDQEFLALALRRLDPARVRLVVGSSGGGSLSEALLGARDEHAEVVELTAAVGAAQEQVGEVDGADGVAARAFVWSECTASDTAADAAAARAYERIPEELRRRLHDERADELEALGERSLHLGAIPFHREHGSDLDGVGRTSMMEAVSHCIGLAYYSAALELCDRLRVVVPEEDFVPYYIVQTKRAQCLAPLNRGEECEPLYYHLLARTGRPELHMSLYYALGMLYTRLYSNERKDHDRARAFLNTSVAIATQLEDPEVRAFQTVFMGNGKALAEMHRGNLTGALELVEGGIARLAADLPDEKHHLHRSVLHHNRAQLLASLGRLDEAMAEFDFVIGVDPYYPEYRFDRGNLHLRLGELEAALADYNHATRLGPPFPELFYNRGEARIALGDVAAAVTEFSYVLDLEPDHLEARISLASLLLDSGEPERAAAVIRTGLVYEPDSARLLCTLGLALVDGGEPQAATEAFDEALVLDPALAEARVNRAVVAYQEGRFESALEDLTVALAQDPGNADLLFNRGLAYEALGRWDLAAEDYAVALLDEHCDQDEVASRRAGCLDALGQGTVTSADPAEILIA